MPNRLTPLDFQTAAIELKLGTFTTRWEQLMRALFGDVAAVASLPAVVNRFAYAAQPSLGAADEGYIAFETTYGHMLRWTGTVWEFAPGDPGNGYFEDFAFAPQSLGWKLCDGTATDYLVVGAAALTVTAITPPNLSGSPAFRKSAAAYTGAIDAAAAPGVSVGGALATEAAHTHSIAAIQINLAAPSSTVAVQAGAGTTVADAAHSHGQAGAMASGAGSAHTHGLGTLAATADATGQPARLGVLPYFRR